MPNTKFVLSFNLLILLFYLFLIILISLV